MHKDEAIDIAHNADNLTLTELLSAYATFHSIVENTPLHIPDKEAQWQRGLHAAIGLSTEAAELLDAHKKELYGKNRPVRPDNIREECGDVYFYLHLIMDAYGITLKDVVRDNVVKLANRYIEKFDV